MAQNYTRQSSFADGDTITSALFNNEYNQLVNAFAYSSSSASSTGHRHDGTAGEGGNIHTIGDLDFLNKIVVDSTNNRWGFYVEVSSSAVEQIRIQDGAIVPVTDNDIDLGTSSLEFKDAYFDGTVTTDALVADTADINGGTVDGATIGANSASTGAFTSVTTTGNVDVGGNLTVTGTTTFNGGTLTLGDAASDNVVFGADVDSSIIPDDDDTYDLGSSSQEWRNLFIDGTANIDSLVADTADINGGTVDGAVIGGSSAAAITGTTITGTSFVIGSADINEAELETIDGVTAGTVAASKAIVVDSNKDFTGARNITLTGELDAGSLDVSGDVDVDGTLETDALSINGTAVTSTAAELNILDGVTSTAAELNILDGVTSTAAELNLLDGVTSTTAELNILDGVTASAADINLIDGITNGTVIASKAIITDSNKDITGGRNITISGELDAATLDISGDADIDGTLEADAITIQGIALSETIADTVGGMVTSNTETGITVTFDDSDNTLDFVIGTLNQDTTGNAATATALETARTIHGVSFDGTANIDLSEVVQDTVGAMFSSNTETGITATYQDSDGTIDLAVGNVIAVAAGSSASNIASGGTVTFAGTSNEIDVAESSGTITYGLPTNVTIGGTLTAATLDISGDVDVDGTLEADAITVNGTTLAETISDTVGAMVSGNTETNITVTYDDSDNTLDFAFSGSADTTGNAATATALETARTIHGVSFDGTANIDLTEVVQDTVGAMFSSNTESGITVDYQDADGTIDLTVGTLNQNTTGSAATLTTARTIGGVSFDGSANIVPTTFNAATFSGDLNVDSGVLFADVSANRVGVNQTSPDVSLDLGANTDAIHVPVGTTAQRPGSPAAGYFRYNTTTSKFEGYTTEWGAIAGGGSGTNMDTNIFAGDGSDTTFTLSTAPDDENNLMVFIDGVFQAQNVYSVSGTTLTFATAPANGRVITVYHSTTTVGGSNNSIATMTGDGSDTTLTLSVAPVHENNVSVFFDGVYQSKSNYSISGTTLTFSTAPASGVAVEAITATNTSITTATQLSDADGDTLIQTEESSDEDKIRFDTGGTERAILDSTGLTLNGEIDLDTDDDLRLRFYDGGTFKAGLQVATSADDMVAGTADGDFAVRSQGNMLFSTGGNTARMTVDSSGNVGIGNTTPSSAYSFADDLVVGSTSGAHGISIVSQDNTNGALHFTDALANDDGVASYVGYLAYNHASNYMFFGTSSTERMRIDSSGKVGIGTTSPASGLHISGGDNTAAKLTFTNTANTNTYSIHAQNNAQTLNFQEDGTTVMSLATGGQITATAGAVSAPTYSFIGDTNTGMSRPTSDTINFVVGGAEKVRIDSDGTLMAGATSKIANCRIFAYADPSIPAFETQNTTTGATNYAAFFRSNGGTQIGYIKISNTGTEYNTGSDYRLKENVRPIENGLERLNNLNPVKFDWKEDGTSSEGFIAHEAQEVFPYAVSGEKDGETMQGMDYGRITPLLVKAIQEQQTIIEDLKARIETLEG